MGKQKKIRDIIPRSAGARKKEPLLFKEVREILSWRKAGSPAGHEFNGSQEQQMQGRAAKSHLPLSCKLNKVWDGNSAIQGDQILTLCVVEAALD